MSQGTDCNKAGTDLNNRKCNAGTDCMGARRIRTHSHFTQELLLLHAVPRARSVSPRRQGHPGKSWCLLVFQILVLAICASLAFSLVSTPVTPRSVFARSPKLAHAALADQ